MLTSLPKDLLMEVIARVPQPSDARSLFLCSKHLHGLARDEDVQATWLKMWRPVMRSAASVCALNAFLTLPQSFVPFIRCRNCKQVSPTQCSCKG